VAGRVGSVRVILQAWHGSLCLKSRRPVIRPLVAVLRWWAGRVVAATSVSRVQDTDAGMISDFREQADG
jgi:hypothetical protein